METNCASFKSVGGIYKSNLCCVVPGCEDIAYVHYSAAKMGCLLAGLRLVPVCFVLFVGLFGFVFLWFLWVFSLVSASVFVWSSGSVSVPVLVLVSLFVFACFVPFRVCFRLCLFGGLVP